MNITIYLHNNTAFSARVDNYDAAAFAQSLNDPKILMVAVGNIIVNKNTVQMIAPSPTETPAE